MDYVEQLKAATDRIDAITKLAAEEDRNLSAEESAEISALETKAADLQAAIKQAEADSRSQAELAARQVERRAFLADTPGRLSPRMPLTVQGELPTVRPYRGRPLRAFHGDEEGAYRSGMQLLATVFRKPHAREWCLRHGVGEEFLAMSESSNPLGGYLVIPEFERAVIDLRESYGVFRQNARNVQMGSDTWTVPRRTGGLTAYFVAENSEITASNTGWDAVQLTARKLAAMSKYSTELAEDAIISVADDLASEMAYAFAVKEDSCGFNGTGATTYGGVVGLITRCAAATATVVTAATGNTAFSTLDLTDLEAMVGKLPAFPGIQPKWFVSKPGWAASMMRLADAAGGNTSGNVTGGPTEASFLGYPVVFVNSMNATLTAQTSTNGLVYFGDLSMAATMGTRRGISVMASADRYFEYDQLAIKATERFDIVVHDVGDTSVAGAIIMLATPGS